MRSKVLLLALTAVVLTGAACSRRETVETRLQRAEALFQAGDLESAEIEFIHVLKANPRHASALARMGGIAQSQGQWPKAMAYLSRARDADTNNVDVRRSLALTCVALHRFPQAREEAAFVLARVPADPEALFAWVDAARGPAEIELARRQLSSSRRQGREGAAVEVALGELALRQRELAPADAAFRQALSLDARCAPAFAGLAGVQIARTNFAEAARMLKAAADLSPARSFLRMKWADWLLEGGRRDEAKDWLEQVAKQAPGYEPALNRLARIHFDQRRYEECEAVLRRVLTGDPLSFEGRMLHGRLLLARGDASRAVMEFERMAQAYARVPSVRHQLALAQLLEGSMSKAIASLSQAVALDPAYAEAVMLLAELQLRRGDSLAAINGLTQLIKRRPELIPPRLALADAHRARGSLNEAAAACREAMAAAPREPLAPYLLGGILRQQKKPGEARRAFHQALHIDPDFLQALAALAELDIEARDYPAARSRVDQFIAAHPKSAEAHFLLAQVHLAQGDSGRAEEAFLRAIESDPDFSRGYVAIARLMAASGRQTQARQRLETLVGRNSKDIGALMLLAMLHDEAGEHAKAGELFDRILALNPQFVPALNNGANLFALRLGQMQKGLELARRARELMPFDPVVADTLGWIHHQRGDYATALALLEESARKLPGEPEVLFHLGMAYYSLGEESSARTYLQRALQPQARNFAGRDEAERRLALLNFDPAKPDPQALALLEQRLARRADDPIAVLKMSYLLERRGQIEPAVKLCEDTVKSNPNAAAVWLRLAGLHAQGQRNPRRALECARKARVIEASDPEVAFAAGRVALECGDYAWASSVLQDAARQRPEDAAVFFHLGQAHHRLKEPARSREALRRALELDANAAFAAEARRLLAELR